MLLDSLRRVAVPQVVVVAGYVPVSGANPRKHVWDATPRVDDVLE